MNITIGKAYVSNSQEETEKLGREFASLLLDGNIVLLYGELGSGKTCFVRGIASKLGCNDVVKSPSFTILRQYEGSCILNHVDLYRLKTQQEIFLYGIEELFQEKKSIVVVEWAERLAKPYIPAYHIEFKILSSCIRQISFNYKTAL